MRLPLLFRRENSAAARREREEKLERAVTAGLRTLADLLKRAADLIESRRLHRGGYHEPEQFLERTPGRATWSQPEASSSEPAPASARSPSSTAGPAKPPER